MTDKLCTTDKKLRRGVELMKKGIDILRQSKEFVNTTERRLKTCQTGANLLIACVISTAVAIGVVVPGYFGLYPGIGSLTESPWFWGVISAVIYLIELCVFWAGIIIVYLTSQQLGLKWRSLGAIFGMIPVINVIMLFVIIATVRNEVSVEREKIKLNEGRRAQQICRTRYPILLVHGVFSGIPR